MADTTLVTISASGFSRISKSKIWVVSMVVNLLMDPNSLWLKSEKTARLRLRLLSNCNTLPSRGGNGADFHHWLLSR